MLGDNLTVPCVASGNPKPDIVWTRMGNNRRIDSRHGCLEITNAKVCHKCQHTVSLSVNSLIFISSRDI